MRNFKRFLTLALAVLMVVSVFTFSTSAATFTDVDADNEYLAKAVDLLSYLKITKGTSETTFGTDELVTREQMAAFIYRFMKKGKSDEGGVNTSTFVDLEDPTFFFMISWANSEGIIKGTSDTTFNPKGSITLQDAYTMLVRALGYETEQSLPYPFGYIGVAEDKGVELDEGLSSEVSYTTPLTRGDVAVLLYNAFFAETGVAETIQVEQYIGDEEKGNWVLKTETVYPIFCEKYFDVVEVEYQAVATPNYTLGNKDTTKSFGYDAIHFVQVGTYTGEESVPTEFYWDFADLGLEGKADDYIMSHFNMYVTLDKNDDIEEVLYAEPLMVKKTVDEIGLETLTTNTPASYVDEDPDAAKHLSGKVTLDGEVAYFFNAPYSYATPNYKGATTDAAKYNARNAENLELISLALKSGKDDQYQFTVTANEKVTANEFADLEETCFAELSLGLIDTLTEAYVGALYSADVYDVDGDGIYDYMLYKPYSFAFADTDEKKDFNGTINEDLTLYTNEATVVGAELKDEDAFIAWINADANLIEVVAVVEAFESTVANIDADAGELTLDNGKTVSAKDGWKLVANYLEEVELADSKYVVADVEWTKFDNDLLASTAYDADGIKFWAYEGVVLFQEGVETTVTYDGDLIIVTPNAKQDTFVPGTFVPNSTAKDYIHVWVGGEVKYVPVDAEADVYPQIIDSAELYEGLLATYKVDKDGVYTITPVFGFEDEDGNDLSLAAIEDVDFTDKEDAKLQGYFAAEAGYLKKYTGGRFQLVDENGAKLVDATEDKLPDLLVDANTVIIVRNEYESGSKTKVDFVELTADNLTNSVKQELTNIQLILANNTGKYAATAEKLVVLYAEVTGEKLSIVGEKITKADRIISNYNLIKNTDGDYVLSYKVINPYTGESESYFGTRVEATAKDYSADSYAYGIGDVVELDGGKINDDNADSKISNVSSATEHLYWVLDYFDNDELLIGEIPADGSEPTTTYRVSVEDATVLMIGKQSQSGEGMYRYANGHVVGTMEALADNVFGDATNYKSVCASYFDKNEKLVKAYGKYVKVYLNIDWEDANDATVTNEDGVNGEAAYIVAVANNGEAQKYCDLDNAVKA